MRYFVVMAEVRRWLLIWLMAVLLPLQGWAAAAGLPCAPGQHAPPLQESPPGERAGHEHAHLQVQRSATQQGAGHEHHGTVNASAAADSAVSAGAESAAHDGAHTCSACAACCPGAAPPSAVVTVPLLPSANAVPALSDPGVANAVVGGLERPPRAIVG
jgi:hypothetical protein